MKKYLLAIDQGTTSSRAIIFDRNSNVVAVAQKEFTQYFPKVGWVEHDANEIWLSVLSVMAEVFGRSGISPKEIEAIGITNQRETTVVWDKISGLPVHRALVWQSRQSKDICEDLKKNGYSEMIKEKTGLIIDSYFSASKIKWIFDNVNGTKELANENCLLFGTIDTWLLWKLSGGESYATDYSNASRTMLYNIYEKKWDVELCKLFDVPLNMLPEVKDSSCIFGHTLEVHFFGCRVPIAGMAGDQQAALFGQTCWKAGSAKNTYGTGCFMLMNTKDKAIKSTHGLLTTLAWGINGQVDYALEGSVFVAGSAIQWLRDGLKIIDKASDSYQAAVDAKSDSAVVVVPAFVGLGAPYWNDQVAGAIFGLTRGATDKHLIKATLESIAYQTKDILQAMERDSGIKLDSLSVDGGACANDYLMQFQSDILQVNVERKEVLETTALGAAYLAGLAIGYFNSLDDIKNAISIQRVFKPEMDKEKSKDLYKKWQMAIEATAKFIV